MQRRSRGRIEVGSTDKVTSIQASLSLRLNGLENQSQVAGSILPRQACPPRAALGWPDHSPEKPMRETVPACCARAASGHAAAAPPMSVMKSRRVIRSARLRGRIAAVGR